MTTQETAVRAQVVEWMVNPDVDFQSRLGQLSDDTIINVCQQLEGWYELPTEQHEELIRRYVEISNGELP